MCYSSEGKGSWQSEAKDDLQLGREQNPNSTVAVGTVSLMHR